MSSTRFTAAICRVGCTIFLIPPASLVDAMNSHGIRYLYFPRAAERLIGKWIYPYGAHQIGVRNGQMATWINLGSQNHEYNAGEVQPGKWTPSRLYLQRGERQSPMWMVNPVVSLDYRGEICVQSNPPLRDSESGQV